MHSSHSGVASQERVEGGRLHWFGGRGGAVVFSVRRESPPPPKLEGGAEGLHSLLSSGSFFFPQRVWKGEVSFCAVVHPFASSRQVSPLSVHFTTSGPDPMEGGQGKPPSDCPFLREASKVTSRICCCFFKGIPLDLSLPIRRQYSLVLWVGRSSLSPLQGRESFREELRQNRFFHTPSKGTDVLRACFMT